MIAVRNNSDERLVKLCHQYNFVITSKTYNGLQPTFKNFSNASICRNHQLLTRHK